MIAGQLTDPGVNFASVPVTVLMSFSMHQANFERRVSHCTMLGNLPCRGNFSPCEDSIKVGPGQK